MDKEFRVSICPPHRNFSYGAYSGKIFSISDTDVTHNMRVFNEALFPAIILSLLARNGPFFLFLLSKVSPCSFA
jgi:hypothetical protein